MYMGHLQRALFLNGDDLTAATEWLDSQKSAPKDPGNIPGTLSSFPEGHRDAEVPPTVSAGNTPSSPCPQQVL